MQGITSTGKLDAWIDFNRDGSWSGLGEQISSSVAMVNGNNTLTFDVPSLALDGTTFARFRLSTAGNLSPEGAADDGEVEDYAVTINRAGQQTFSAFIDEARVLRLSGTDQSEQITLTILDGSGDIVVRHSENSAVGPGIPIEKTFARADFDQINIDAAGGDDSVEITTIFVGDDSDGDDDPNIARIDGGSGMDTLRLSGSGGTLDLTKLDDDRLTDFEVIDISGSGPNTLTLNFHEVMNLTANSNPANTLSVLGNEDDMVNIGTGWAVDSNTTISGVNYQVFIQGSATLRLEQGLHVNRSPEFTSSATPSVPENTVVVGTVLATDPDDIVSYSITGGADQSVFTITFGESLSFRSAPNFENPTDADGNNTYLVQVTASDGIGGTTVQNVTVTVTNVNDAPTINVVPPITIIEDAPQLIPAITVTDVDATKLAVTLSMTHGGMTLGAVTELTFSDGANGGARFTISGPKERVNAALATLTYTPDPNFNGSETLTAMVSDLNGTAELVKREVGAQRRDARVRGV